MLGLLAAAIFFAEDPCIFILRLLERLGHLTELQKIKEKHSIAVLFANGNQKFLQVPPLNKDVDCLGDAIGGLAKECVPDNNH
jgi:hypothetical protein